MENKIGAVMPHNIDAEEALLGAILLDSDITIDVMPVLSVGDFYSEANRIVFECMKKIYISNRPIDYVTLLDELELGGNMQKIGGIEQLSRLLTSIPSSANFKNYLDIVKRDSLKRSLIRSSQSIIETTMNNEQDVDILAYAEKQIFDVSAKEERGFPTEIGESCKAVIDRFELVAGDKNAFKGLTTGFSGLDEKLNGMQKSDLILIAARPSEGKTSLGMNIVENAALKGNATCLVFSLEMSKVQLTQRMICSNAKVKMERAIKGQLTQQEWDRIIIAKEKLANSRILIDDTASINPSDVLSKCQRVKAKQGLDLIMIDYLGLMSGAGKFKDRQQEVSEISRRLKLIAREMNCPLLALSQLSRNVENRVPPIPQLSDLRDSGAIEQDADIVMFIYNPSKNKTALGGENFTGNGNSGNKEIHIAKHRNGPLGIIPMSWNGEYVRFGDIDNARVKLQNGGIPYQPTEIEYEDESLQGMENVANILNENPNFVPEKVRKQKSSSIDDEIYGESGSFGELEPPSEEEY